MSIDDWLTEQEAIIKRLTVDYNEKISEDVRMTLLMRGIPSSFNQLKISFASQLDSTTDRLTVEKLKKQLKLHEQYCGKYEGEIIKKTENMALTVMHGNASVKSCKECGSRKHNTDECWNKMVCGFCKIRGHPSETCFRRHPCKICGGYHSTKKCFYDPRNSGSIPANFIKKKCNKCGKYGHVQESCPSITTSSSNTVNPIITDYANLLMTTFNFIKHDVSSSTDQTKDDPQLEIPNPIRHENLIMNSTEKKKKEIPDSYWIADSGASHHVTHLPNILFNVRKPTKEDYIVVGKIKC